MSELFPCPNPACTNWNPAGREKCFRCGHVLSGSAAEDVENPGGRHPFLLPGLILGVVALLGLGILVNRWSKVRTDKTRPVVTVPDLKGETIRTSKDILEIRGTVEDLNPDKVSVGAITVDVVKGAFFVQVPVTTEEQEIKLVAIDKAGNKSDEKVYRIAKDAEVPTITQLSAADGSVAVLKSFIVTGTASEALQSASIGSATGEVTGNDFTVTVDLKPGEQTLAVRVTDLAGNVGEKSVKVTFQERQLPEGVTTGVGGFFVAAKDGASMALIPEGPFTMGTKDFEGDERPPHDVKLSPYLIDVKLVTNAQYQKFCDETGHARPANPNFDNDYFAGKPDSPVVNVSYE